MISLFALILVLLICEGESIFRATSSTAESQLRRRNSKSNSIEANTMQREMNKIQEEKDSFIDPQPTPQPAGFFDFMASEVFACLTDRTEQIDEVKEPLDDSKPVKLATRTISGYEAVLLAPALLENSKILANNFRRIETIETLIAAAKIKSLVPDQVVKLDWEPESVPAFRIEENEGSAPDSSEFIAESIVYLIKTLKKDAQNDTLNQINSLNFSLVTLDEFINEKKSEISKILDECATEICRLKHLLHSSSPALTAKLTVGWLHRIIDRLNYLFCSFYRLNELKVEAYKSFFKEMMTKRINTYRDRIGQIIENLAIILEKL